VRIRIAHNSWELSMGCRSARSVDKRAPCPRRCTRGRIRPAIAMAEGFSLEAWLHRGDGGLVCRPTSLSATTQKKTREWTEEEARKQLHLYARLAHLSARQSRSFSCPLLHPRNSTSSTYRSKASFESAFSPKSLANLTAYNSNGAIQALTASPRTCSTRSSTAVASSSWALSNSVKYIKAKPTSA
jgi:hypothetical protein